MSYGPSRAVYNVGIASGASTSSGLDLQDFGSKRLGVRFVTMSTGAALTVYGSSDGQAYYPVHERVNTSSVQYQPLVVATSVSGAWAVFDTPPFRYLQFVASATITNGASFTVCSLE